MKLKSLILSLAVFAIVIGCEDDEQVANGTGVVSFSVDNILEVENATQALSINVGVDQANHAGGTVDVSITGGDFGTDFDTSGGASTFTVEIPRNGLVRTFSIIPVDDDEVEDDTVLTVSLSNATGALELGEQTSFTYTILDNDDPLVAMVSFENTTETVQEDDATSTPINITFNQASTFGGSITVEATGEAVFGTDYTVDGQTASIFTIDVPANATNSSFNVQPIDNADFEADKNAIFTITEVSGGLTIGATPQTTVTIENDDNPPNPVIDFDSANTLSFNEGDGTVTVNFEISSTTEADAMVELTANGMATVGSDFDFEGSTDNPYTFTIPSGSSTFSITLNITDDTDIEGEQETFTLDITNVSGGLDAGINTQSQTFTIVENDSADTPINYTETFEGNDGTDNTYLIDVLGFQQVQLTTQTVPGNNTIDLQTNAGNFADVDDETMASDNGLNFFYNSQSDPANNGQVDTVLISPVFEGTGDINVMIDNAFAFRNQNNSTLTYYWTQNYDGSGNFDPADWTVVDVETVADMDGEGFGNNDYKRQNYSITPDANFYVAIRIEQTIDDTFFRLRWRFDNLKVISQ